jgi:hypothetical protein
MLSNLEARGVEPLFPTCYVQQRPRMLYQSHFRGEYVSMNKRGRTRMLLVLLLPWQAFGNIRNRSIGPLVSVTRTVGSGGSRRKRQTIRRRSRLLKSSNGRSRPSGHLSKFKIFWTGYTQSIRPARLPKDVRTSPVSSQSTPTNEGEKPGVA